MLTLSELAMKMLGGTTGRASADKVETANMVDRCEEAVFVERRPALLTRPTGGVVEVMAGLVDDRLVREGDIGLGPAAAMQVALVLRGLEHGRPDLLSSVDPQTLDETRSFAPRAKLYRRAWQQLRDRPGAGTGEFSLGAATEELDAWRRGTMQLGIQPYGAVITDMSRLWPGKRVRFKIDYTARRSDIIWAIEQWQTNTNLRFQEVDSNVPSFINFVQGSNCESEWLGCSGGEQKIRLTSTCRKGTIAHEIGHAVGLYHEHVRHDRNQWVTILDANVKDGYEDQFEQYGTEGEDNHYYDYASIMHYPRDAFAKPGRQTIVPKQSGVEIGQRDRLSSGDVAAVQRLYP